MTKQEMAIIVAEMGNELLCIVKDPDVARLSETDSRTQQLVRKLLALIEQGDRVRMQLLAEDGISSDELLDQFRDEQNV